MFQACEAGDVADIVMENFQVFQVLQAADGGNVRQVAVVDGHDQGLQLRKVVQEGQVARRVVADIQRQQIFAVFQDGEVFPGMPGAVFVMQGGKGRGVGPDSVGIPFRVGIVRAADHHGPAEFNFRKPFRQLFNPRAVNVRGIHIQFFQIRKGGDEFFQLLIFVVPRPEGQLAEIHIL